MRTRLGRLGWAILLMAVILSLPRRSCVQAAEPIQTVIVHLKAQVAFDQPNTMSRAERQRSVLEQLQAVSAVSEQTLAPRLQKLAANGTVQDWRKLWVFNGYIVRAAPQAIAEISTWAEVAFLSPEKTFTRSPTLPHSAEPAANLESINAPELWERGFYGQGVVVANLDTGVSGWHPDLAGQYRGGVNSWFDPYNQHPLAPFDADGHGTMTMGIMVAGSASGQALGTAPRARWIAAKIFRDDDSASTAAIHQAFQWILDPDGDPFTGDAPHVVNNSWDMGSIGCDLEFQSDLLALRAAGILPIFAAGNFGPNPATSASPANNPSAFAVGAVDNSGAIYPFSSRGPTTCGGSADRLFPLVSAPGVDIFSTDLFGMYYTATGTSMAAPHAGGVLALLLSAYPDLTAAEQEAALLFGAQDLADPGADNATGYGKIDALASFEWLLAHKGPPFSPTYVPFLISGEGTPED